MSLRDGKAVISHEDHEPLRNGRARSPLRAADAVNVASSRGAHGVTRPTGNGRFRESLAVARGNQCQGHADNAGPENVRGAE